MDHSAAPLKRRVKDAELPPIFTPHRSRVMAVTDLLGQDVPIEDMQNLASHQHPATTQVYDRRARRVTRNIVERISVAVRRDRPAECGDPLKHAG